MLGIKSILQIDCLANLLRQIEPLIFGPFDVKHLGVQLSVFKVRSFLLPLEVSNVFS